MKRFITFAFALSLIFYLGTAASYAQGKKGGDRGRDVNQRDTTQRRDTDRRHDTDVNKRDTDRNRHDADRPVHDTDVNKANKTDAKKHDADARRDNRVGDRIERNPELTRRLRDLLPRDMDLKQAANGFKNDGQFISALHVSRNLDIPFASLKSKLTGPDSMSLGNAIHQLKPNLSETEARKEAEKAAQQAKQTERINAEKTKRIS